MASEQQVIERVIDPMSALFGKPYGCRSAEDVEAAQAQYIEALSGFSEEALVAAWIEVRRAWSKTVWPPIAVIAEAARAHGGDRARRQPASRARKIDMGIAERWLWETDNGRLAVERDVCEPFVYRAVEMQQIPPRFEVLNMTCTPSTITDAELEAMRNRGPFWRAMAKLGRLIRNRNTDLRERALRNLEKLGVETSRPMPVTEELEL
jgi:hypothetical protein